VSPSVSELPRDGQPQRVSQKAIAPSRADHVLGRVSSDAEIGHKLEQLDGRAEKFRGEAVLGAPHDAGVELDLVVSRARDR
jgi:hypothetical protein